MSKVLQYPSIPERNTIDQLCLGLPFFIRAALGLGIYWLLAWCSSSLLKYWMVLFKPSSSGTCKHTNYILIIWLFQLWIMIGSTTNETVVKNYMHTMGVSEILKFWGPITAIYSVLRNHSGHYRVHAFNPTVHCNSKRIPLMHCKGHADSIADIFLCLFWIWRCCILQKNRTPLPSIRFVINGDNPEFFVCTRSLTTAGMIWSHHQRVCMWLH